MDPVWLIALPWATLAAASFAAPVAWAGRILRRARGRRRNEAGACASCSTSIQGKAEEVFLFDGTLICPGCAGWGRRGLTILIPLLIGGVFMVSVAASLGVLLVDPGWTWVFNGFVVPASIAALGPGLIAGTAITVRLLSGKAANGAALGVIEELHQAQGVGRLPSPGPES